MSKNKKVILDSSAILTLIYNEKGIDRLEDVVANASISTVNYSEVISVLTRKNIAENDIDKIIVDLVPEIIPFTKDIAIIAGKLIASTQRYGLSFGGRACIATGIYHKTTIYTTDKAWANLNLEEVHIELIR